MKLKLIVVAALTVASLSACVVAPRGYGYAQGGYASPAPVAVAPVYAPAPIAVAPVYAPSPVYPGPVYLNPVVVPVATFGLGWWLGRHWGGGHRHYR